MLEIKISGRGGQGVVVAASTLGLSFFNAGMFPQCYSVYGGERRGAPVVGFLRVDTQKVLLKCEIRRPNSLIYMDESLFDAREVRSILKDGDTVLINTTRPLEKLGELRGLKVGLIDAARVSESAGLGKIINTTVLGAYCRLVGQPDLKCLLDALTEAITVKSQANRDSAQWAYESVKITEVA
ncbi:MAG: 2-oxoacid:acceptor oxidoreductase family protein [Desulfuromonadaceae bacterium]|nr:2-oxoacid:acceptor oxidoreductase family protein [Desulfuromonadaceae bacterium]